MSYLLASALQAAVFQALSGDATVAELSGGAIYDAQPLGATAGSYISLGPEDVVDISDRSGPIARHDFTISVVTDAAGFQAAKTLAEAVNACLTQSALTLPAGRVAGVWFRKAKARRVGTNATRRIDLTFRALVSPE
ncbi:DUF3168 domain-containing protein [Thioclava litoralis]|uniref:DUF3168 domain-containing protein n=1 Tax=Thioclava litoralis TaxID=3076557 RepID=A0ABZ1DYY8_9RHOB|nr:DUF3168 domain-containing protein [Thioclava sp. FTW29]